MTDLSDWEGVLENELEDSADLILLRPHPPREQPASTGGSNSFKGKADDGNDYHIKTLQNGQSETVPAIEQIVGRVGKLVEAPVCTVRTIRIPQSLFERENITLPNTLSESGIAHGSRDIGQTASLDEKNVVAVSRDNNRRRYVFFWALYDWCCGDDAQWLFAASTEDQLYSHDHGYYLPGRNGTVDVNSLEQTLGDEVSDNGRSLRSKLTDLDGEMAEAARAAAQNLRDVQADELIETLSDVPSSWPIGASDLERIGWFLYRRAPNVADRLQNRIA